MTVGSRNTSKRWMLHYTLPLDYNLSLTVATKWEIEPRPEFTSCVRTRSTEKQGEINMTQTMSAEMPLGGC